MIRTKAAVPKTSGEGQGFDASVASLEDVVMTFPSPAGGNLVVLDGINLSIKENEFVCLVGRSGCGKTTVLNLLAGFVKPTQGEVHVRREIVRQPGPDRPVVFQNPTLFPWATVLDNVTLGSRKRGISKKVYLPQAKTLIEEFGLSSFQRYLPYQLSGGMKQRVQIARALMGEPTLLLMDEPFGALDSQTRLMMQEHLVATRKDFGCSVLFITHDVDEAVFLGDRVIVMSPHPGRIERELEVSLPSRGYEVMGSSEFSALKTEILQILHSHIPKAS